MYIYNYGTGSRKSSPFSCVVDALADDVRVTGTPTPQGYVTAPLGHAINPAFVPPPPIITSTSLAPGPVHLPASAHAAAPVPASATTPVQFPVSTPSPTPAGSLVQVPPGCYPLELVQFWRNEYKRGQPYPLHWALFVRTASPPPPVRPGPARRSTTTQVGTHTHTHTHTVTATSHPTHRDGVGYGHFYELVGVPDTFTAQFLATVAFSPEMLPDWRGTLVVGWVHPAAVRAFERVARGVRVWRQRPEWRCQEWVFEVLCVLGEEERKRKAQADWRGWRIEGWTFPGLQRQMGKLLDAWENGDI
ncbi:hypothetical protein JVT61DRAFT_14028 [Boletus reticuloceps]|uniref:Uncharacterized protein n=1 Tax=Boletus reticuloceps TaxID=495285 RepID=A0A8I2YXA8_9AGAM|nr:hypothetical protein JVT61DRAFT_14028 [Boletus reticuloceps]